MSSLCSRSMISEAAFTNCATVDGALGMYTLFGVHATGSGGGGGST